MSVQVHATSLEAATNTEMVGVARRRPDFAHCRRFGVQQAAHAERPRIPLSTAVPPYLPRHEPCAS